MKPSAKMGLTLNPSVLTTTTTTTSQISATTKTPTWIRRFARGAFTSSTILRRKETSKIRRSVARNDASLFQATDSRRRPSQRRRRTTPASKTAKRFFENETIAPVLIYWRLRACAWVGCGWVRGRLGQKGFFFKPIATTLGYAHANESSTFFSITPCARGASELRSSSARTGTQTVGRALSPASKRARCAQPGPRSPRRSTSNTDEDCRTWQSPPHGSQSDVLAPRSNAIGLAQLLASRARCNSEGKHAWQPPVRELPVPADGARACRLRCRTCTRL